MLLAEERKKWEELKAEQPQKSTTKEPEKVVIEPNTGQQSCEKVPATLEEKQRVVEYMIEKMRYEVQEEIENIPYVGVGFKIYKNIVRMWGK